MAVFGYIFLAREKENLVSADEQESALRSYAQSMALSVDEFIFEGDTPLKDPFAKRKEGGRLLKNVQSGDAIVVLKSQWILSSASDGSRLVSLLREKKVALYCADLETNISLDEKRKLVVYEGGGGLIRKLLSALAVCEGSEHGDAIKVTKKIQKLEGKYLGGPVPFGWEVNKEGFLVYEVEQQKIISAIAAMREDRRSFRDISRKLKEEHDLELSHERVRRILHSNQKRIRQAQSD